MNNDIRRIVEENWEDIKALVIEKAEAEQKPKTIWDLKKEDSKSYYCLNSEGVVENLVFNSFFDEGNREMGNAFLTRKEAEFEAERRKVEQL
jgi:hypothetical protein|nr:hypothetical protein [uncultured Peptostreptococcus sp.]